jgi:hypothetical protein
VQLNRLRRPLSIVLMLAVLLASTLGLVHGTLHAPGLPHGDTTLARYGEEATAPATATATAASKVGQQPRHGWLSKLFDHEAGGQCRLYDQLHSHCAPLAVLLVVASLAPAALVFHSFPDEAPAWRPALFDARGPPLNH